MIGLPEILVFCPVAAAVSALAIFVWRVWRIVAKRSAQEK